MDPKAKPRKAPADAPASVKSPPWMAYATVTTTGAAVMMIEVLGTRVIAPFYGVGLFVWTALLTVALVALAIGYRIGGRLADRRGAGWLPLIIGGAAVLVAIIPLLRSPVLHATDPLGLRLGSLVAALILFGPPLTLLGMVGPYVIRMVADSVASVGTTAGSIFAVSTFGSVAGTLLVGFVLLPSFGTRGILLGLSAVLLGLAVVVRKHEGRGLGGKTAGALAVAIALLGVVAGVSGARPSPDARFEILQDTESLYGRVRVVRDSQHGLRWMLVDASAIGAQFEGTEDPPFPYLYALETLGEFRREARKALVIGLGAGYLPRALAKQGMTVDSIEIDDAVVDAARDYFGFRPPGRMIVGDARYEIRQLTGRYDLIIHDCFTGGEMPWHLFSAEMLQTLRDRLEPGGILALNFFGLLESGGTNALSSVARTLDSVFPHRLTLAPAPGHELFDRLFLVSDRPITLPSGPPARSLSAGGRQAYADLAAKLTLLEAQGAVVTDDYNPLESLQLSKGEAYRRVVLSRFSLELLAQ